MALGVGQWNQDDVRVAAKVCNGPMTLQEFHRRYLKKQ